MSLDTIKRVGKKVIDKTIEFGLSQELRDDLDDKGLAETVNEAGVYIKDNAQAGYQSYARPLAKAGFEQGKEHLSKIGDKEAEYMRRNIGTVPKPGELERERNAKLRTLASATHPPTNIDDVRSPTDYHAVGDRIEGSNPQLRTAGYDIQSDGTPLGTPISTIEPFTPTDATDSMIPPQMYFTTLEQLKIYMGRVLLRTTPLSVKPTTAGLDARFNNHPGYNRVIDAFKKRQGTTEEIQRYHDIRALDARISNTADTTQVPHYYTEMSATEVQMLMGIMKMPMNPRSLWWRLLHTLNK